MREYKKVYVTDKALKSIKNGHPWIYGVEIVKIDEEIQNGDLVDVLSLKDKYLGTGFYNDNSKITVRLLSKNSNDTFDKAFFKRRIKYALDYRLLVIPEDNLNAFRLIYGEADELPGLTVDKFNDILVVQILSLGMEIRENIILDSLYEVMIENNFEIHGIYLRNDVDIREKEGLKEEKRWYNLGIPHPEEKETIITENGIKYYVDYMEGQKTGFFLDQKFNRMLVRSLAKDKKVLDCCTHTGSFAMNAYLGGAKKVVALDISNKALMDAKHNFLLNEMDIDTVESDIFLYLENLVKEKKKDYDMIILDPPPFTKSRKTIDKALKGYQEINYLAMKALPRGGILVTASCSHFVDDVMFHKMLHEASLQAGVSLKEIAFRKAAPDHPILLGVFETDYLKFCIFQVF